ncbi:MAG: GNAT family N-acetyltransferase [Synechococcales cyanobacterium M58_A2018_015]|nr:GNAT family N-acetyltransferase [Synechococcales cyanobacterium M58_A2018_015]
MPQLALATTDTEICRCFAVLSQLRPHLIESEFLERIRRQMQQGYQMLYAEEAGRVQAVAGFRLGESLAWGKFLYIDDLITDASARSQGYGTALWDWLIAYARSQGCQSVQLDSGVQRSAAHRFYFRQRMAINSYHFGLTL